MLHITSFLSAIIVGEYSTALVFNFALISTFFKSKYAIYLIYLPLILFINIKLFASTAYLLFFVNFVMLIYFTYRNNLLIKTTEVLLFFIYFIFLTIGYNIFEGFIYQIYIDTPIYDKENPIDILSTAVLILLNFLLFLILGYL
jgi:hypothetical protein